ncbi:MAG TPA: ribonuclease III [Geminicoccaceae bacterium]|nr:ribonuclease III [Geminicoccaceae bacterium]
MTGARDRLRAAIEARLDYRFRSPQLLDEAVAHGSVPSAGRRARRLRIGNERLEFLGDRVLGLVVAELLMDRFPDDPEGFLARRHARLVRRETLAEVGVALGLEGWLAEAGGGAVAASTPAVLADSCEALIGAIYLDGGLAPAARFIREHWSELLDTPAGADRDAKTALQEWAQARALELPTYRVLASTGPMHAPLFEVEVALGPDRTARGEGPSKRTAELAAAAALLARLQEGTDE